MKVNVPLDEYINQSLGEWAERLVQRIRVEMHNQGLDASGNLSDTLEWEIDGDHVKILADDYFIYAEGGRPAGRVPMNFSFIIERWIANKGVIRPPKFRTDRQFAWAIVHNIRAFGSSKHRGDRPKDDVLSAPMSELLPELNDLVRNRVVMYLNDNLF